MSSFTPSICPPFCFSAGCLQGLTESNGSSVWAVPYLVFQWLYTSFVEWLGDPYVHVQFSRPYWILWYLFVLAVYTLLLPVYDTPSSAGRGIMVAVSVVLALLVGFDKSIDYQWSASRIVVFQPWFLLGTISDGRTACGRAGKERDGGSKVPSWAWWPWAV